MSSRQSTKKVFYTTGLLALGIGALFAFSSLIPPHEPTPAAVAETREAHRPDPFDDIVLEAKAAIVYDVEYETALFAHHAEIPLPIASITKLFTAFFATRDLGENKVITITLEDLATEGASSLLAYEQWTVGALARYALITSANPAAATLTRTLSEYHGVPRDVLLTQEAKRIGLEQTILLDGVGLDISPEVPGAYSSAHDVAKLLAHIYRENPALLEAGSVANTAFTSQSGFIHPARSTNELAQTLPQLVGAKTGYTLLAGGNLATLVEIAPGRPVAIVVLGASRQGRFSDTEELISRLITAFAYGR